MSDTGNTTSPHTAVAPGQQRRSIVANVPEEIAQSTRQGWIAAVIYGVITMLVDLVAIFNATNKSAAAWSLLDAAVIFALAFGIYRKSRISAILMLAFLCLIQYVVWKQTGFPSGVVIGIVLAIFFFRAIVGTFRYHAFAKRERLNPSPPKQSLSDDPLFRAQDRPSDG